MAPIEDAGQRVHDRLVDEPAMQVLEDAPDHIGQDDGERQRDGESNDGLLADVVVHERADDQEQQDRAQVGHAPRESEGEQKHLGIAPQHAEKALRLESAGHGRGGRDEEPYQRNRRGFLQVDGESVDGQNQDADENARRHRRASLHVGVDRERQEKNHRGDREGIHDPLAVSGERICSEIGRTCALRLLHRVCPNATLP